MISDFGYPFGPEGERPRQLGLWCPRQFRSLGTPPAPAPIGSDFGTPSCA